MGIPESFEAASKAAESWLNTVHLVAHLGERGGPKAVDSAYTLLLDNLQESHDRHAGVLVGLKDELAAVSDGPIKWESGRGWSGIAADPSAVFPARWSSAHEAAEGIAGMTRDFLCVPIAGITDPAEQKELAGQLLSERWKAIAISIEEVADYTEHIRRERAKILRPVPKRLDVNIERMEISFDGKTFECRSEQALLMLQVYAGEPGRWFTAKQVASVTSGQVSADKVGTLKDKLPPEIRKIIQGDTHHGSRLVLPPP